MTLREATPADRARLIEMAVRFVETTAYRQFCTADPAALAFLVDDVLVNGTTVVAVSGGRIVGMLAWEVVPHILLGDHVEEVAWWVEPEHRGGSIGVRLLRYMEDWCVAHAQSVVRMLAPDTKTGKFYARVGFRPVETAWLKVLHGTIQEPQQEFQQPDARGGATD